MKPSQRFASSLDGLAAGEPALILSLLRRVEEDNEKHFVRAKYLEMTVLRCDAKRKQRAFADAPEPTSYAIFFCFPYLHIQTPLPAGVAAAAANSDIHLTRTLLQSVYPLVDTALGGNEPILRRKDGSGNIRTLHVPQLWGLVLSSGMPCQSQYRL
jgi:hypothetical protein